MSRSFLAALLAVTLLTTGCATRTQAKVVAGTLGVASGISFVIAIGTVVEAQCTPAPNLPCEGDMEGVMYMAALGFTVIGAILAGSAYSVYSNAPKAPATEVEAPPTAVAAVEPAAILEPPARTTDDLTRRLARQAIRAATSGQCAAARVTLRSVADRDGAYHVELRGLPIFERCL